MKLRLLLCFLAGVAVALAIIFWPGEEASQRATKAAALDAELEAVITASERGEALRQLMEETPEAEKDFWAICCNLIGIIVH